MATALTIEAEVHDGGTLSYQWYRNESNSATGGTSIPGATSESYMPSTAAAGTTYYYCVAMNTNDSAAGAKTATVTSQVATITVTQAAPTEYVILFNANGGTVSPDSATTVGRKLENLPTPTRSGYTFDGWYTEQSGGEKVSGDTVLEQSTTLYAHWTEKGGSTVVPAALPAIRLLSRRAGAEK